MDVPLGGQQRALWYIHDPAEPPGGLVRGLVVYLGAGRIGLDRLDSLKGRFLALVGLAGRNDLAVPGLQVEVELAAGALFSARTSRPSPPPDSKPDPAVGNTRRPTGEHIPRSDRRS